MIDVFKLWFFNAELMKSNVQKHRVPRYHQNLTLTIIPFGAYVLKKVGLLVSWPFRRDYISSDNEQLFMRLQQHRTSLSLLMFLFCAKIWDFLPILALRKFLQENSFVANFSLTKQCMQLIFELMYVIYSLFLFQSLTFLLEGFFIVFYLPWRVGISRLLDFYRWLRIKDGNPHKIYVLNEFRRTYKFAQHLY